MNRFGLLKRFYATKNDSSRRDVISSGLCDDIVRRLAPSLASYIGCTILDYHPGHALFSKKLHEFLKPRKHILFEPEYNRYSSSLDPLLKEKNTRYVHKEWPEDRIWDPAEHVKEGLLPKASDVSDHPILQIVNATGRKIRTAKEEVFRKSDTQALHYAFDARHRDAFFAHGPVRMLMWCRDIEKKALVPRTIDSRRKSAIILESYCHVDEVVGFGWASKGAQREQKLNIASSKHVRQRMKERNIYDPDSRAIKCPEEAESYSTTSRYWHEEIRALEEGFASGKLTQFIGLPPAPLEKKTKPGQKKKTDQRQTTPEYDRYVYLQRILGGQNSALAKTQNFADQQQAIDDLYLRSASPTISPSQRTHLLQEVDTRTQDLKQALSKASNNMQNGVKYLVDDRRAFHMPGGPLLMWDQRPYEPLKASTSEFSTPTEMALLDFQANPEGTLPLTNEQSVYFDVLASALFASKGNHDLSTLKTVAPGAYEALVPKVEELKDAREGGRRSVKDLSVRTITPRILWRLAVEWDRWPFKPDMKDVLGIFPGGDAGGAGRRLLL